MKLPVTVRRLEEKPEGVDFAPGRGAGIKIADGRVWIEFDQPVKLAGLTPQQALSFAAQIDAAARRLLV